MTMNRFRPLYRPIRRIVFIFVVIGLALVGWAAGLRISGNVHEVVAGQVFRAAQPSPEGLKSLIREHGLKTVINLRGEHPDESWYRAELTAAAASGVKYVSLPLSATEEPDDAKLKSLINLLKTTETPFLLHCEAGADRSGLAAALYRLLMIGDAADHAAQQLSFRYGHFPWLISRTGAMDRAFWRVANAPEHFVTSE